MKKQPLLKKLSNRQLHSAILLLARQERESTLAIVDHLIEIERRRLYAGLGHSSIYGYCTDELGYSRTAANRRIVAARTVRRFPRVRRLLLEREITLSTLAAIGPDLNGENCRAILDRVCGKSCEDARRAIAELRGIRPVRERIQRVVALAKPAPMRNEASVGGAPLRNDASVGGAPLRSDASVGGAPLLSPPAAQPSLGKPDTATEVRYGPQSGQPAVATQDRRSAGTEHRIRFEFSGDEAFMALYQRAAALASNRLAGRVTIEAVMKLALEALLDRDDPARRQRRRKRRASARVDKSSSGGSRHIPAATRDAVYERDGGRCTFVSPDGRRCRSVRNLQIDHVVPWAKGGTHEPENLRLMCATHNRMLAAAQFGRTRAHLKRE